MAVKPKSEAKPGGAPAGFFMYIGPYIPGLLQSGQIFPGTREEALKACAVAVEKHPLAKTLLVPGETLPADRLKVKTPGTALYDNYRKLAGER